MKRSQETALSLVDSSCKCEDCDPIITKEYHDGNLFSKLHGY